MSDRVDFSLTDEPWIEVMLSDGSDYLAEAAECLKRPVYPLFLGRRSCPPVRRVEGEIVECPVVQALADNDWRAAEWYRRTQASSVVLDVWRESVDDDAGRQESIQDQPISVNVDRHRHGWRAMLHDTVRMPNPLGKTEVHIPAALGG